MRLKGSKAPAFGYTVFGGQSFGVDVAVVVEKTTLASFNILLSYSTVSRGGNLGVEVAVCASTVASRKLKERSLDKKLQLISKIAAPTRARRTIEK